MNVELYLERIGYHGPRTPDPSTLVALHAAHLRSVPFENLDIHLGREIKLEERRLYRKIVEERRGGFCYELNGLFAWMLRSLGFSVTLLSGRVAKADGGFGPEFDHMTLQVDLDEPWLADVGFGESFVQPLRLRFTGTQADDAGEFRITAPEENAGLENSHLLEHRAHGGDWKRDYIFTLTPRLLGDYVETCDYHQTSPLSTFTQKRVCTIATTTGRRTLRDDRLIITENGVRVEERVEGEYAWRDALRTHFGIELRSAIHRTKEPLIDE